MLKFISLFRFQVDFILHFQIFKLKKKRERGMENIILSKLSDDYKLLKLNVKISDFLEDLSCFLVLF